MCLFPFVNFHCSPAWFKSACVAGLQSRHAGRAKVAGTRGVQRPRARERAGALAMGSLDMSHFDEIAEKHAPSINAKIDKFEAGDVGQIQALGGELLNMLAGLDLSYQALLHHSKVGVASCNRSYDMLCPTNVHNLLGKLCEKGWNPRESENALVGELDDFTAELERECNKIMIEKSDGLLPSQHTEEIDNISIAGSHTTTVLRLADGADQGQYKTSDANKHLCGEDGYLSKQRIFEVCPSLKAPATTGIRYTVIRKQIIRRCPRLMQILCEADNSKHSNFQHETPMQIMSNIHRLAVQSGAASAADWAKVVSTASRRFSKSFETDACALCVFRERILWRRR